MKRGELTVPIPRAPIDVIVDGAPGIAFVAVSVGNLASLERQFERAEAQLRMILDVATPRENPYSDSPAEKVRMIESLVRVYLASAIARAEVR
jgi:hypothetical protein